jgi:Yip1-like protein
MASLLNRMVRAAKLDSKVYEEVEHDENATMQAVAVVFIASLAPGIGALLRGGIAALIFNALAAFLGWVVWACLTYLIGTRLLPEPQTEADLGQMLRTTAFSNAPGVIGILGIIPVPGLNELALSVAFVWTVIAMVIAVRQALDFRSTGRAIGVCLIALLIVFCFVWLASPNPFVGTAV